MGSSLELSQRLEEPLSGLPGIGQEHHIFDIEHGLAASKIWQTYEQIEQTADSKAIQVQQHMSMAQSLRSEGKKDVEAQVLSTADLSEHQGKSKPAVSDSRNYCNRTVLTHNYSDLQMTAVDQKAEQPSLPNAQTIPKQPAQPQFRNDAPSSSYLTIEGIRQVYYPRLLQYCRAHMMLHRLGRLAIDYAL